jgi:hypothetical protein
LESRRFDADGFFLSRVKGFSNCNFHFVFSDKGQVFMPRSDRSVFSQLKVWKSQEDSMLMDSFCPE